MGVVYHLHTHNVKRNDKFADSSGISYEKSWNKPQHTHTHTVFKNQTDFTLGQSEAWDPSRTVQAHAHLNAREHTLSYAQVVAADWKAHDLQTQASVHWLRRNKCSNMAMVQNQWYHFGIGAPPILVYFRRDWDAHRGYGVLTHGHMFWRWRIGQGQRCDPRPLKLPTSMVGTPPEAHDTNPHQLQATIHVDQAKQPKCC